MPRGGVGGRQDKSAPFGGTHVVGGVGFFAAVPCPAGWHRSTKPTANQALNRQTDTRRSLSWPSVTTVCAFGRPHPGQELCRPGDESGQEGRTQRQKVRRRQTTRRRALHLRARPARGALALRHVAVPPRRRDGAGGAPPGQQVPRRATRPPHRLSKAGRG